MANEENKKSKEEIFGNIPFGGDNPEAGFTQKEWKEAFYNYEIDSKTGQPYGYRIKTDDGTIFGSEVNKKRIANGFKPM